jgi:hypothetical protein
MGRVKEATSRDMEINRGAVDRTRRKKEKGEGVRRRLKRQGGKRI